MPDRVWEGPVAARTRDAGGSDTGFAGGVSCSDPGRFDAKRRIWKLLIKNR